MQMRISPTAQPGEERLNREGREFLAYLRSVPPVPKEDDPNDWLWQIRHHLRRSPGERLERWASFADGVLRINSHRLGLPHLSFDPLRVLRALSAQRVAFVMVGMGAGYLQGAPYPSYNTDITPRTDPGNIARMEQALAWLHARPLDRDEWGPVAEPTLPGFSRLKTAAGMVNVVDALPGVGGYDQVMESADLLDVSEDLSVWVAALEDVIRNKEAMTDMTERPRHSRTMDSLHVLMGKETLAAGQLVAASRSHRRNAG